MESSQIFMGRGCWAAEGTTNHTQNKFPARAWPQYAHSSIHRNGAIVPSARNCSGALQYW